MDIYIARQPIFDDSYEVLGYELLYRKDNINKYDLNTPDNVATSILLLNTYLNFGLETLVGNQRAFINFGNNLIKNSVIDLLCNLSSNFNCDFQIIYTNKIEVV